MLLLAATSANSLFAGTASTHPLILAASKGHAGVVQALLRASANVLAVDATGGTALHRSAGNGHVAVIETLLAAAKSKLLDRKDNEGHTAFHLAAIHEQSAACIALAEAGAELNTINGDGEAPASLLKPSLRSQLGLLGDEESAEDFTDWLAEHYPVPNPAAKAAGAGGAGGMYL